MKNKIKVWKETYKEISENEWEGTSDTEEREECLSLIDWDGEPVAYFRIVKSQKRGKTS